MGEVICRGNGDGVLNVREAPASKKLFKDITQATLWKVKQSFKSNRVMVDARGESLTIQAPEPGPMIMPMFKFLRFDF